MKKILCAFAFAAICSMQSYAQHVSTGLYHSLAICDDGIVRCFGRNDNGQLGIGNTDNQNTPIPNSYMNDLVQADAGGYFSMFRNEAGNVWFSGSNAYGNFGNGTTSSVNTIPYLSSLSGIVDIAAGFGHAVVVDNSGDVYAAGWGNQGQVGNGVFGNSSDFVAMPITGIIDVEAGYWHSLMLSSDGTVWACGSNNLGQLGMPNTTPYSNTPIQVPGLSNIVQISAGSYYSLFVDANGVVYATGSNPNGQLGNGNNITQFGVVQLTGLPPIAEVIAGNEHSFFRTAGGTLYGVGLSNFGQNGVGTNTSTPMMLSNPQNVIAVAAGGDGNAGQSLFLTSSGEMWGCGSNGLGVLGTTGPYIATPTLITALCGSFLPVANFTPNTLQNCLFPDPCFDFVNESLNATEVHWTFGHPNVPESNSSTMASACYGEPGTYTVTLTATNEFGIDSYTVDVVVYDILEVTLTLPDEIICSDGEPVALSGGMPEGGQYSGSGVTDGIFDPAAAGVGPHTIFYEVITGPGCGSSDADELDVSECLPPYVDFGLSSGEVCILDPCIDVTNVSLNYDSLVWYLPGTEVGFVNNQSISQICFNTPGTHLIKLSVYNAYDSASYAMNVIVHGLPEVTLDLDISEGCANDLAPVDLAGGLPTGGTYSGTYVDGGQFELSQAVSGEYDINYTYVLFGQCQATATQVFTVLICDNIAETAPEPTFSILTNPDGTYNIQLPNSDYLGSELRIFNSLGQLLYTTLLNNTLTRIDRLPHAASIDILQLTTTDGVVVKKVGR